LNKQPFSIENNPFFLSLCTTDFSSNDKEYQNLFLPQASENVLILAKKVQDKYVKTKAVFIYIDKNKK
jgi:hypothetical protein